MAYTASDLQKFRKRAVGIWVGIREMISAGKVGHLQESCFAVDITSAFCLKLRKEFDDSKYPQSDRCIFSEGHAALATPALLQNENL